MHDVSGALRSSRPALGLISTLLTHNKNDAFLNAGYRENRKLSLRSLLCVEHNTKLCLSISNFYVAIIGEVLFCENEKTFYAVMFLSYW